MRTVLTFLCYVNNHVEWNSDGFFVVGIIHLIIIKCLLTTKTFSQNMKAQINFSDHILNTFCTPRCFSTLSARIKTVYVFIFRTRRPILTKLGTKYTRVMENLWNIIKEIIGKHKKWADVLKYLLLWAKPPHPHKT